MKIVDWCRCIFVSCISLVLIGCGAALYNFTSLKGGNSVGAAAQWSNAIILDLPKGIERNNKSVYLQASVSQKAASDDACELPSTPRSQLIQDIEIYRAMKSALIQKGYYLHDAPEHVGLILQVRVRQAGVVDKRVVQHALSKGYGAEILELKDNNAGEPDNAIPPKDVDSSSDSGFTRFFRAKKPFVQAYNGKVFSMIFDVQILAYQRDVGWMRHQTRLVTTSDKIDVPFAEMVPQLTDYTAKQIALLF